jgi:mycofactocin system glycosyltransferase
VNYRLADGVSLVQAQRGPALLSLAPLRLVQINTPLARLVGGEGPVTAKSPGEARVLAALAEKGLLQAEGSAGPSDARLPTVSVVIPVKDRAEELGRCLHSLEQLRYPKEKLEILVVDDGSLDGTERVARSHGATVLPSGGRGRGPAAARNRGAAVAKGELLAFLDSDCTASAGWLAELAEQFEEPSVVAVGGRVEGMHATSWLDRYEAQMSSLSLGPRGRSGQAGRDTFYLPSCNLVVRRRDFAAAGGFREELHVGEDVDLTWRLRDRGGRIVYTPAGPVDHEHRTRLGPFLRRRFEYGTSEGMLQQLHPERRKQFLLPAPLAAATLALAVSFLAGAPLLAGLALALVVADGLRLRARLATEGVRLPRASVVRARLRSWASLGYYLAFHLIRYYLPVLAAVGLAWPRFGLLALGMAVGAAAVDHAVRRPALRFPAFLAIYLAEHAAYGAGVFVGCARLGTFASYRPLLLGRE